MLKSAVIRHAREVVERDMYVIEDHYDELLDRGIQWGFGHCVDGVLRGSHFFGDESEPTPGLKLVRGIYQEQASRRRSARHIARFAGMMLADLSRVTPLEPRNGAHLGAERFPDSCGQAEGHFHAALEQLETGHFLGHSKISIYHDTQGEALLLRKKAAESTALTLAPLALSGMTLPPGTIVAVDSRANAHQTGSIERARFSVNSYLVGEDIRINPLRFSAWAYDEPMDRTLFAVSGQVFKPELHYYSNQKAKMLERTSLQDFVIAAEMAIEQAAE